MIFVIGIHVFAFTYFLTYSALRSVDASLEESAQMLGARRWQTALRINLPLVAPAITGGALLAAINSLALFGPQAIIGTPAQIVFLPTRIYATIGSYPPRWGEASALSLVLVALTVAGLALQRGYLERRSYITVGGRGVRTSTSDSAPGAGRCWLLLVVVFFSAAAPIGVLALTAFSKSWTEPLSLANFTLRHFYTALFQDQVSVRGILNSFKLATAAATIAVAIGASSPTSTCAASPRPPAAGLSGDPAAGAAGDGYGRRYPDRLHRVPLPIYCTISILLVAYVARFIPLATAGTGCVGARATRSPL